MGLRKRQMKAKAFPWCVWLVLALLAIGGRVQAQVTWNNAGTGNWFTNTNWTPNTVPTSAIDASINNGGTAQVLAAGGAVRLLTLGASAGQSGTLQVSGGTLTTSSSMAVGDFGTGTLTVSNGGVLTSGITGIGNNAGSTGTLTVTGANSRWNVNGLFDVGSSGNGTLNVTEGGTVSAPARIMSVGNDTTSAVGLVVITGNTLATSLTVGASNIGNVVTSSGRVEVHGALASYAGGSINVGVNGPGTLIMDTGATGTASGISMGVNATLGATGTFTLNNATMAASATVSVGISNTATMTLSNGAVLTSSAGRVANNTGAVGQVTVTGANTRWTMTGDLNTGSTSSPGTGGSATISVLDGGLLRANRFSANSAANINVSGAGSRIEVLDSASIGSTTKATPEQRRRSRSVSHCRLPPTRP
ncbi:hypothetical protein AYO49_01940 [Verrucomicrobiaceae bacterium SCGC AG-212-N21]|nr:hypothetical protein AYO49_01940 [Verrucomicrobiaceae bacterium SCGC AG-212-N21]